MVHGRAAGCAALALVAAAALSASGAAADTADTAPVCEAGGDPVVLAGEMTEESVETYELLAVDVAEGTTRVEVGYEWHDLEPSDDPEEGDRSVLDLGIWDADGSSGPDGFRGWSGSRQGLTAEGQEPVFITTIANPVFLADQPADVVDRPAPALTRAPTDADDVPPGATDGGPANESSAAAWEWIAAAAAAVVLAIGLVGYVRRRRRPPVTGSGGGTLPG